MPKSYLNRNKSVRVEIFDHLLTEQDSLTEPDEIGLFEACLYIKSAFGGGEILVAVGFATSPGDAAANAHQLWKARQMEGPSDV